MSIELILSEIIGTKAKIKSVFKPLDDRISKLTSEIYRINKEKVKISNTDLDQWRLTILLIQVAKEAKLNRDGDKKELTCKGGTFVWNKAQASIQVDKAKNDSFISDKETLVLTLVTGEVIKLNENVPRHCWTSNKINK